MFKENIKSKNVKKYEKTINEVQKKTAQQKKTMECTFMLKKCDVHRKQQETKSKYT